MSNGRKTAKILIVDDDPRIRRFVQARLAAEGYEVTQASNGQEGLDQARLNSIDLIVLDLMMPVMDGWEMLKQLRGFSKVPVIILSAQRNNEGIMRGINLGADEYVSKPFNPDELVGRIKTVLSRAGPSKTKAS